MRTTKVQINQPAHPRSLISAFVVRCLDSITPLVSISEFPSLYLASVTAQTGLSLPLSQTPKTGFIATRLNKLRVIKHSATTFKTKSSIRFIKERICFCGYYLLRLLRDDKFWGVCITFFAVLSVLFIFTNISAPRKSKKKKKKSQKQKTPSWKERRI